MTDFPKLTPTDDLNIKLLSHVHPPDWVNPVPAPMYNMVVVGGGTAGLVSAAGAAGLGAKVALVEEHFLGGDCLNVGCVPSKSLIASSRAASMLHKAGAYGITTAEPVVDFENVMKRLRRIRSSIANHDSADRFRKMGVDIFLGHGRFTGTHAIEVQGNILNFRRGVIATGGRAWHPSVPGLSETGYLTNENIFNLVKQPKRLAVIGGGPIGCELAQAFANLGSKVLLLHKHGHLLNREDTDAAQIVEQAMLRDGVDFRPKALLSRVDSTGDGKVLCYTCDGQECTSVVDEILVSVRRTPNIENLDLEKAGVAFARAKGIQTDDFLRTTNPHIYAAGDVCMATKFTHAADAAARIVINNALFFGRKRVSALNIPWATYTDPEIAHVGLYEKDAEKKGIATRIFKINLADVDRAVTGGVDDGFVKILVPEKSDRILGATIAAPNAGDMISEITVAMAGGLGLTALSSVIHPYPTMSEAIKKAGDAYNRTRLTPIAKKLLAFITRMRR